MPLGRPLGRRRDPQPGEILLLGHERGGLGQHGVDDDPAPPEAGEGPDPDLDDGHLAAGELVGVRADGAGVERDPERGDAAHLADADLPLEVVPERGAGGGEEARLDEGPRPELRVPGERGGDGEHGGEYGAAHEEEPLPPYGGQGPDQGLRARQAQPQRVVVVVVTVPLHLAGAVAGVGDLEAEERGRVEAREGEDGPRDTVAAAAGPAAGWAEQEGPRRRKEGRDAEAVRHWRRPA